MFKSLKLFRLFGVDIKAHWSWVLMFILFINFTDPIVDILYSVLTVLMIFSFVLVHEYGHIFAGRKYGLDTPKVVLSFLGGAAFMDDGLETLAPKRALWVAFAGPLTNLIMFLLLIPFSPLVLGDGEINMETVTNGQMLYVVAVIVNVMMFVFNLLPIYPMDGGRLLRSTLELFNVKHTLIISVRVTQVLCIGLVFLGFYIGSWTMPLIGGLFFLTSFLEIKKKREDEIVEEVFAENKEDVINKIETAFEINQWSDETKLLFLDELDAKTKLEESEVFYKNIKIITDEFRENIRTA